MLARKGKKFLALLLTLCMVVGMLGTAALAAEGDETGGTGSEPESTPVGTYTITPEMTQKEVDAAVAAATGEITVEPGDYGAETSHIKLNLTAGSQTVRLSGEYTRLMVVVLSEANTLIAEDTTIIGEVSTVYNQSPAIYIPYGSLTLEGSLNIVDHDYGVILGYTNAAAGESAGLTVAENAALNISGCTPASSSSYDNGIVCANTDYFSHVDTQGDGTRGSAITTKGKGSVAIALEENAVVDCQNNSGAGIFAITVGYTLDAAPGSKLILNNNGQGLCMNTDYVSQCTITLDNATMETCNNSSNGITGQGKPYVLNVTNGSVMKSDNNGGIGINNFYIVVSDSEVSVSDNRSHGCTNVALTAEDSTLNFDGNAYIGLNVTKLNADEDATRIEDSTVYAQDNGGPGIRFYISGKATEITSSKIYAGGNGVGNDIYGYAVNQNDSGYWAGIVGKGNVTLTDSFVYGVSAAGYSLYNDSTAPAALYISGTDVVALEKTLSPADLFDDWNSKGNTGRTYVTGGSLQASADNMTKGFTQTLNQQIPAVGSGTATKEETQFAAPVNANNTALTRFDLNSEFNHGAALTDNGDGTYTFQTVDPNSGETYAYTFRYNEEGEDLVEGESGNAYVWTPVTVISYDATEGAIAAEALGTAQAGDVALNSRSQGQAVIGNSPVVVENSYIDATDYTISGSSMALSEAVLPTADRSDYVFSGWYYAIGAENITRAAELAATGSYSELYELLRSNGAQLTADTLTSADGDNVAAIAVYALWEEPYTPPTPSYDYYTVTVNYLDKETGEKISASYVSPSQIEGSRYDVTDYDAIAIDGYTYDSTSGDALTGILNSNKVVNVYYVAEETDIDDDDTPTTDLPDEPDEGGETDIPDDDTPTGDLPDQPGQPGDSGETDIPDGDVPTGNLPQTGTTSSSAVLRAVSGVFLCLAVVFGCATVVLFRKEREQG